MSSDLAVIEAEGLSKVYQLFLSPTDRLKQMLFGATSSGSRSFSALSGVGFRCNVARFWVWWDAMGQASQLCCRLFAAP